MTYTGILIAVAIGLLAGIAGPVLFKQRPRLPGVVALIAAVAGAMLGTVLADLSGLGGPGYGYRHLILQTLLAVTAVTLTIAAGRGRTPDRSDPR
ncbi:hypothetical protein [Catenuloplanes indicus]|uniref:Membrane protein YeaQ/YmgE (Transglycosylase-associated protein family) n=1 Tax=Catenuloplanes indicus TaxID=137267 RepID=A0AAE3VWQ1_9ACTN|nr:hypothetical protein [Catenuloplanes indicus]MDQ0365139.1 putative membrane protein YeaQ/YmgE (transglycosylase-associated protein family) [Catenuloplanes indicus]